MPDYLYIPDLTAHIPEIPPDSIVSRTFYQDHRVRMILFGFAPGQELSDHTSSKPAVLHFLKGEADLTLGKDKVHALAGTWIYMPPNLPHSVLARSPVVMMITMFEQ